MFSQKYGVIHLLPVCRYYNEFSGGNLWKFQLIDEKNGFLNAEIGFQSHPTNRTRHWKLLQVHNSQKYRRNRHFICPCGTFHWLNYSDVCFLLRTGSVPPHTPSHPPPSAYVPSGEARFLPEEGSAGSWQHCPFSCGCPGLRE